MYLSPSQYNDLVPGGSGLEKVQEARYGKFIFCSVLLHLILLFCFITFNHVTGGYLHPGEKVVEVSLLNIANKLSPLKSSSNRNNSVKEIEPAKHVSHPPDVIKTAEKTAVQSEKNVVKIIPTEINSKTQPVKSPEVLKKDSDIDAEDMAINNDVFISDVVSVSNKTYDQNSIKISEDESYSSTPKGNGTVSQGQQYIDENFYYVKDLITRNLIYPVVARRMKWQGTVEVSFVVLETGHVKDIRIITSSGHSVLDKNVVETINQVQPFPPPPVQAEFTMPIKYTLKN